jgi:hypothetical protein
MEAINQEFTAFCELGIANRSFVLARLDTP